MELSSKFQAGPLKNWVVGSGKNIQTERTLAIGRREALLGRAPGIGCITFSFMPQSSPALEPTHTNKLLCTNLIQMNIQIYKPSEFLC